MYPYTKIFFSLKRQAPHVHVPCLLFYAQLFPLETLMCSARNSAVLQATASLILVACHESALYIELASTISSRNLVLQPTSLYFNSKPKQTLIQ